MRRLLLASLLLLATLGLGATAFADDTGTVTILHGVPGLDVDVYADGDVLIDRFTPGEQFGPIELPAGDYDIAIRAAGEDPGSDPALAATVTVPTGVNATAIAHLDAEGAPKLTVFGNDTGQIEAGSTRLVVRHTSAFGAVDVLAGGDPVISGLTNPDQSALELPAGTYDVAVTAAGDHDTEAFRGDVALDEGTMYLVHAIGDPTDASFDLLIQTVDGLHTPPATVDTGTGGPAAGTGSTVPGLLALFALAALGLGVAKPALARRR